MKLKENLHDSEKNALLLKRFNDREGEGFGEVYLYFHDELHYFAGKLFQSVNIAPDDVIQDIFIRIWEKKEPMFDSLSGIKSYLYIAIKNRYLKHLEHLKRVNEYNRQMLLDDSLFVALIAENEIFSTLSASAEFLPEECAKVFKLCLEGWDVKEIAEKLGKSESTVYKQKTEAINILRKKLSKKNFVFLLLIIN